MVLIYGILLNFMNTYGGFKIGYLKNGNLIYSQIISVFENIVTYLQIAVIDRRFINPVYLLPLTIAEIVFIVISNPDVSDSISQYISAKKNVICERGS